MECFTDAVPNPPSNLRATMHTATSITFTWTEPTLIDMKSHTVTLSGGVQLLQVQT